MDLTTLFGVGADAWSSDHEETVVAFIREGLITTRTLRGAVPCSMKTVYYYWSAVAKRITSANADVIHTGGVRWDGTTLFWNFSGWPAGMATPARSESEFLDFDTFLSIEQVQP